MTLKPSNGLIRWAYVCETPPTRTTLCALAWRVVVVTPLKIGVPSLLAGLYVYALYAAPWDTLGITSIVVGTVALVIGFIAFLNWTDTAHFHDSFIYSAYRAIKDRYCPLVWIND